jgi:hypothetical protein
MITRGTVQGDAALKYVGFRYRKAVPPPPISCIWDIDPDRVYADREYPRFTGIHQSRMKVIDVADYEIRTFREPQGLTTMRGEVWMMPNRYSPEGLEPFLVLTFRYTLELDPQQVEDFAVREAFRC